LGVGTVLEGSVRKGGNKLRVTAQLINVADGFHLWSERYDREMDDVFAIQDEIAAAVVEELEVSLLGVQREGTRARHTDNLEAYELYLRGRYFWNQRPTGLEKGLEYFRRTVELDPEYALAYAGMADAFSMIGMFSGTGGQDAFFRAKAAAKRALELDPLLAEAHATLGFVAMWYDWDWALAEGELLRALELNPHYVEAHLWYAHFLGWFKADWEDAIERLRHAHEIDPLSVVVMGQLGGQLIYAGRIEEGLAELEKTLELAPGYLIAHVHRGTAFRWLARYEESIVELERAVTGTGASPQFVAELAITLAKAGRLEEAQATLDEGAVGEAHPVWVAGIYATMGKTDAAFEFLEAAYEKRDPFLPSMRYWPDLIENIDRNDPRYRDLLRRLALP
jgi:tetratricopeptide (TPR) repeat protein